MDDQVTTDIERLLRKKGYKQGRVKTYLWWRIVYIDDEEFRVFQDLKKMDCYMYKSGHQGPSCHPPDEDITLMGQFKALTDTKQMRLI